MIKLEQLYFCHEVSTSMGQDFSRYRAPDALRGKERCGTSSTYSLNIVMDHEAPVIIFRETSLFLWSS